MDDFHALLRTLMSPDNASRQQAEQAYDGVKQQNPGMLLSCLAQTVRSCADATLRAFGAVLLRRAAHDVFNKPAYGTEARELVKTSLLGSLQEETERSIRTKVADTAVRPLPLIQPRLPPPRRANVALGPRRRSRSSP